MHPDLVQPDYGRSSLSDVLPAVAAALGVDRLATIPEVDPERRLTLPPAPSYVVMMIDGMGARLLERYAHAAPYLTSLMAQTATAGVPSTTAVSLTSLGTGLPPGTHGLVGFTSRVPGTNRLLNHLQWSRDVDPIDWQPHPPILARLAAAGVTVTVVNKREYQGSGLTLAATRGVDFVGADRVGETLAAAMTCARSSPSLTYLYCGDLDWTGHRFGVASTAWLQQLAALDNQVEQLREALPRETRVLVVADHGMVDCPPSARIDIDTLPALTDGLALLGGEARFRHLYAVGGAVGSLLDAWRGVLGDRATILRREEAVLAGWFGAVEPRVLPRIGDIVVASHGELAVMSSRAFAYEASLVGLHGSLTADEMLVPVLVG